MTGQVRARREDTKAAIVTDREYLNLQLNYEDVAEFDYRPGKCERAYGSSRCERTSAGPAANTP